MGRQLLAEGLGMKDLGRDHSILHPWTKWGQSLPIVPLQYLHCTNNFMLRTIKQP